MEIEFSEFDSAHHLAEQRELFRMCFPENEGSSVLSDEHYWWKFHTVPAEVTSYEFKAMSGDKLLAYYAAIPYRYSINGREVVGGMVCDVMTHPDARGHGIFTRIGLYATQELKRRGVDFVTGYPIRPEVMPGHLRVGWKEAFKLPMYVHILRTDAMLNTKGLGWLSGIFNGFVGLCNQIATAMPVRALEDVVVEVSDATDIDTLCGYDEFFDEWSKSQEYYLIKDRAFLKWRLGARDCSYEIVTVRVGSRIVAMAIVRSMVHEGMRTLAVLDVMAVPQNAGGLRHLWDGVKQVASGHRVESISCIMSRYWAGRYRLFRNGLFRTPYAIKFITKSLNSPVEESEFLREENWHLSWIDSDDG